MLVNLSELAKTDCTVTDAGVWKSLKAMLRAFCFVSSQAQDEYKYVLRNVQHGYELLPENNK